MPIDVWPSLVSICSTNTIFIEYYWFEMDMLRINIGDRTTGLMTVVYETWHFRGGAPPYRSFNPSGNKSIEVPGDTNYADLIERIRQEVDPFNSTDLSFKLLNGPDRAVGGNKETVEAESFETVHDLFVNRHLRLIVYIPMRRGCVDIGVFGTNIYSHGAKYLLNYNLHDLSLNASQHQQQQVEWKLMVKRFNGNENARVIFFDSLSHWTVHYCDQLVKFMEIKYLQFVLQNQEAGETKDNVDRELYFQDALLQRNKLEKSSTQQD